MTDFYSTLSDGIGHYTGLSLSALFTILALMVGVYLLVSSLFVSPELQTKNNGDPAQEEARPPIPPVPVQQADPEPVQLGDEVTLEELKGFDGSDPKKALLMAIKGNIYDVSISRMFYGPGGPYALFAGRDASRALALMSFDANDLTGNLEGLSSAELEVLQDWEYKFMEKYRKVGKLLSDKTASKYVEESEETEKTQALVSDTEDASRDVETKAQ